MQYYASHYLWHAGQDKLFRMQRIGLEVSGHTWVSMEPLEEEVRNTQWLGKRTATTKKKNQKKKKNQMSFIDLQKMAFTDRSRLVRL